MILRDATQLVISRAPNPHFPHRAWPVRVLPSSADSELCGGRAGLADRIVVFGCWGRCELACGGWCEAGVGGGARSAVRTRRARNATWSATDSVGEGGIGEDRVSVFELATQSVVGRCRRCLQSTGAVGEQRGLWVARDRIRELERAFKRVPSRNDLLRETNLKGARRVDAVATEDHPQRVAAPDDRGEALRATVDQRDAPRPIERAEGRVLGGDTDVAP